MTNLYTKKLEQENRKLLNYIETQEFEGKVRLRDEYNRLLDDFKRLRIALKVSNSQNNEFNRKYTGALWKVIRLHEKHDKKKKYRWNLYQDQGTGKYSIVKELRHPKVLPEIRESQ